MEKKEVDITGLIQSLAFLDDYLKGATYSSRGADSLTLGAPAASCRFNNGDNVINQYYRIAIAYDNTQTTSVTLLLVYHRHFNHCYRPPLR